jgi:hypothetical protein
MSEARKAEAGCLTVAIELAFLRDALKSFIRALDPVLMLVAFRRHQFDDLECPRRSPIQRASGVAHGLTERIFVRSQHAYSPLRAQAAQLRFKG